MSITRQVVLSLFLVVVVGGGWILYQRPAFVFGAVEKESRRASAARPAPGGGGPRPGGFGQTLVVTAPVGTDGRAPRCGRSDTAAAAAR